MNELATTWPFSSAADFSIFIKVVAVLLAGVGVLAATLVGMRIDGPIRTVENTGAASSSSTSPLSLPVTAGVRTDRLVVGRLPSSDEIWLVAWLRGGRRRLETTLYVAARRAGWLRVVRGERLEVVIDVEPSDPLLARFKTAVARTVSTSKSPVHAAGAELAPLVRDAVLEANLARPMHQSTLVYGIAFAGIVVVTALLLVRAALVAAGLVSGDAVAEAFSLIPETLIIYAAVAAGGIAFVLRDHRQAMAYLRWLDGTITAIRADVRAGVQVRDEDLLLVAAMDGEYKLGEGGWPLEIEMVQSPRINLAQALSTPPR